MRCTGQCCERFRIFLGDDPIQQVVDMAIENPSNHDLQLIAQMLVALPDYQNGWLTCRYYDRDESRCAIYEQRPRMCRDYPYDKPCQYEGCTWNEAPLLVGCALPPDYVDDNLVGVIGVAK